MTNNKNELFIIPSDPEQSYFRADLDRFHRWSGPVSQVSMHRSGFQTEDKFVAYTQLCRKIETILAHIHLAGQFQIKGWFIIIDMT